MVFRKAAVADKFMKSPGVQCSIQKPRDFDLKLLKSYLITDLAAGPHAQCPDDYAWLLQEHLLNLL